MSLRELTTHTALATWGAYCAGEALIIGSGVGIVYGVTGWASGRLVSWVMHNIVKSARLCGRPLTKNETRALWVLVAVLSIPLSLGVTRLATGALKPLRGMVISRLASLARFNVFYAALNTLVECAKPPPARPAKERT